MPITKAFLIHGRNGNPQKNWFPWLKTELEKLNISVFAPQFPGVEKQSLSSWMTEFQRWNNALDEDAILVGHSLGGAFVLDLLERNRSTVAAAFLVASFVGKLNLPEYDLQNSTIADRKFDWNKIRGHCREFFVYSSDNDPYVPLEKGEVLSAKLNAKFKIIRGGGHITGSAGYAKFEPLLADIKKLLDTQIFP